MSELSSIENEIRREFKDVATAFLNQLRGIDPPELPYALLFEISDQDPGAWPIGATEQSLTKLVNESIARGYKAHSGDIQDLLRAGLRWDAPGDTAGWYWATQGADEKLNALITAAFDQQVIDSHLVVRDLCLTALRELDNEGTFGKEDNRNQLVVGISNVDKDFESFLEVLATVNPPAVINRLRAELKASHDVWSEIDYVRG